ncbi:MAG TPA: YkvA family protein [Spirochaetota bacterium]|nr:YkvA family protein [Spirochaetota bacterium]
MYIVESAEKKAAAVKREIIAVYYAYRDPRTGRIPKILIACTLGYLLCPLDLIPDFIPLLGYADDLIIIPVLLYISVKLIPEDVMNDARNRAMEEKIRIKSVWIFSVLFVAIWTAAAAVIVHIIMFALKR